MDDIIQWLTNGKDYAEGVAVLGRHTKNRALIRHFLCTTPKFAAGSIPKKCVISSKYDIFAKLKN